VSLGDANCLWDLDTIQALFMAKMDGIRKLDGQKAMSFSGRGGHTAKMISKSYLLVTHGQMVREDVRRFEHGGSKWHLFSFFRC